MIANCDICNNDSELIILDGKMICPECKPSVVQAVKEGVKKRPKPIVLKLFFALCILGATGMIIWVVVLFVLLAIPLFI